MKTLDCIDKAISKVEGWLIILFLWAMVLLTFLQVLLRSLYTHGRFSWANVLLGELDWSGPLVRLLVLWVTFLGASLLTRKDRHIRIDLLGTRLPEKWLAFRTFILSLICLFVCGLMIKVCVDYLMMEMEFGGNSAIYLPSWIAQLILPVGFGLLCFRFLVMAVHQGHTFFRGSGK